MFTEISHGRPCLQRTLSSLTQLPPLPLAVLSLASSAPAPTQLPMKTFSDVLPMWDPSPPPDTRSLGNLHLLPPMTSDSHGSAGIPLSPLPGLSPPNLTPWATLQTPQTHPDGSQLPVLPKLSPSAPLFPPTPSTQSPSQNLGLLPDSPQPCPVGSAILPSCALLLPRQLSTALPATWPCLPALLSALQAERVSCPKRGACLKPFSEAKYPQQRASESPGG